MHDDDRSPADPALIAWRIPAPLERVRLRHDPAGDWRLTGAERKAKLAEWRAANERREAAGLPPMTARRLYRPRRAARDREGVLLHAGVTTYFDTWARKRPIAGDDPDDWTGAGLSIVPVCADGAVLVGRRSALVDRGVGLFHIAGGHAHPPRDFAAAPQTLLHWAHQELHEEMAVTRNHVVSLRFIGLVVDHATAKPEFVVEARLRDDGDTCIARWRRRSERAPAREEFTEVSRFDDVFGGPPPNAPLERLGDDLVVAAIGALRLWVTTPE